MTLKAWQLHQYERHSGKSKFKQDGSYLPKSKDSNKTDWRDRKGFTKDQSKHNTWCKCGSYLKTRGNRQARRWAKQLIHNQDYDRVHYHQDMFVSSWDAC